MIRSRAARAWPRRATAAGIEFIPGTELTAELGDTEVHLLGYFLDTHNEKLLTEIAKFQIVRQNRIHEMVAAINKLGVPLKAETVFALANCKSPGRPHVARALVKAGLVAKSGRSVRAVSEKRPARVGAESKDVRARRHGIDSSGRRSRGDGASGLEPHGRNHSRARGRRDGRHRMFSHETFDRDWRSVICRSRRNIICS